MGNTAVIYKSIGGTVPAGIKEGVKEAIAAGLAENPAPVVFFRADDIAVPGRAFDRMMQLFLGAGVPLNLALVPVWTTSARWDGLRRFADQGGDLFSWHQHGWRHRNHETEGKKQEFGPARPAREVCRDIIAGKERLEGILGDRFSRFFTPPWNRCTLDALHCLKKAGFSGVSRSLGSRPEPPSGLPDIPVTVDLHTRKETDPDLGWDRLFSEIRTSLTAGRCGIMLHHQRMSDAAFIFLEFLLDEIVNWPSISLKTFNQMAGARDEFARTKTAAHP